MSLDTLRTAVMAMLAATMIAACGDRPDAERPSAGDGSTVVVTGATIFDGTGSDPIADGVLVMRDGRVTAVGTAGTVAIPDDAVRIDHSGRYLVPGLINVHGHVGVADGLAGGPNVHTRDNVLAQLALYARYGVTTVVSLGDPGTHTLPLRATRDSPALRHARLYTSGPVIAPDTAAEAVREVEQLAALGVDWLKFRIDDALGRAPKMSPEVYGPLIETAHAYGLPVAVHIVDLEDAKESLLRGVDLIGHSVRDLPVDDELIALMRMRGVCLSPTLTRELSVFVYAERPEFFDDPFFLAEADPQVLEQLLDPERQAAVRNSPAAAYFRETLPLAERNMVALHEAGIGIAMGTDSGPVSRFQGYFEHIELQMMQDAGMSARDVLLSATGAAARCAGLDEVGTLQPGRWADFIVLDEDPLADVSAMRTIREVRVAGNPVLR
jgi:imidazolonepropionase-like amidohydrolase